MKALYKLFIALAFLGLAACGSDSDSCSPCSTDADCDADLLCYNFSDGNSYCASSGSAICVK